MGRRSGAKNASAKANHVWAGTVMHAETTCKRKKNQILRSNRLTDQPAEGWTDSQDTVLNYFARR